MVFILVSGDETVSEGEENAKADNSISVTPEYLPKNIGSGQPGLSTANDASGGDAWHSRDFCCHNSRPDERLCGAGPSD